MRSPGFEITQKTACLCFTGAQAMQDKPPPNCPALSGLMIVYRRQARNMHRDRRERVITGTGGKDKAMRSYC